MERYRDSFARYGSPNVAGSYGQGAAGVPIMVGGQPYQPQYPQSQYQPYQPTLGIRQQNVQNVYVDEEDVPAPARAMPRFADASYQSQRGYGKDSYESGPFPRFASARVADERSSYGDFVEADDMENPSSYSKYSSRGRAMSEIRKAAGRGYGGRRGFGEADASLPQSEDELMEKAEKLRGRIKKLSFLSSKLKSRMSLTQKQIDEMDKRNMNKFEEGDNRKARDILRDIDVFGESDAESDDILKDIEESDNAISGNGGVEGAPRFAATTSKRHRRARKTSSATAAIGNDDDSLGMGLLNDKSILEDINVDDDDSSDFEEETKTMDQLFDRLTK